MKLDYNIFWIDDKISSRPFQAILNDIKVHLSLQHFNCSIIQAEDFNEFREMFRNPNEYDIIITDFSLNDGTTGKEVIDYVRTNNHNFTEVFFYSANQDVTNIELINKNRITYFQLTEGSYKELQSEIKLVIDQTIKKFQHIVAMRGFIMSETSTLDTLMLDIINQALNTEKIDFNELSESIYSDLNDLYTSKIKFVETCKNQNRFEKLTKDNFVFSSDFKIKTLKKILIFLGLSDFSNDYKTEIITIRNKFAHAILIKDENGREFFQYGSSGITFDEKFCQNIRKNINKYRINLNNALTKIQEL